jgi:hypothetical protein
LPVLAPNTYESAISASAQPSIYSVLPNPVILDFGSFYDDQGQRGTMIANTTSRTVGAAMSSVPIENVNTIVPYGKGSLTTGQVPFIMGGDSGLVDLTPFEPPLLYNFTSHTFTNAGTTGRFGPTLSAVRSEYSSTSWAATYVNMTTQGIQEWTVPATGSYTIRAVGAGIPAQIYGKGMDATIITQLTRGETIRILVGQTTSNTSVVGGAGGTFVVRVFQSSPIALIVAGGGGGKGQNIEEAASNATTNNNGQTGSGLNGGIGGFNGNGGLSPTTIFGGAGGGGMFGNGGNDLQESRSGGQSFINGGIGGIGTTYEGGFGGGGGTSGGASGGGGGGYSGGGGGNASSGSGYSGSNWNSGGGGGSYSITGSFITASATNPTNGFEIGRAHV